MIDQMGQAGGAFGFITLFGLAASLVGLVILALRVRIIRDLLLGVLLFIPGLILLVWSAVAFLMWTPARWLTALLARLGLRGVIERGPFRMFIRRFGELDPAQASDVDAVTALRAGQRETAARRLWPERRFPELYTSTLPDDLQRPLWRDGRLPGGRHITWMADRHIDEAMLSQASQIGVIAGMVLVIAGLIPIVLDLAATLAVPFEAWSRMDTPVIERWPNGDEVQASRSGALMQIVGVFFLSLLGALVSAAVFLIGWIVLALGAALLVSQVVYTAARRAAAAPYQRISKDADVRWANRAEIGALSDATHARQIELADGYLKDAPVYTLGSATGTLRFRGDLNAPSPDQAMKLDQDSLFQHTLVLGGTGEGKTTAVLKPLTRQILSRAETGMFVVDAKGVLWADVQAVAGQMDRGEDVVVLGTGPGQLGMDVTGGLTPSQIAMVMRSVMQQAAGGQSGSDSFFPDTAANVMRQVLEIGRARSKCADGGAVAGYASTYSLTWAYAAAHEARLLSEAMDEIEREGWLEDPGGFTERGLDYDTVREAQTYLVSAWETMAEETRSGVLATLTQLLGGFSGAPALRERFVSGPYADSADIRDALNGKIVLVALSSIEDGLPARLVSILIKTMLYRQARQREIEMKADGAGRPQDKPCVVLMDEVQEIVTIDPVSGLSDATFWNVARSTGLAGVFATQTVAALQQAMGREAAANFIQQARSKIFLRSEDRETVDLACWTAGAFERNRVYDDGQFESLEQRALVDGWSPFDPVEPSRLDERSGWSALMTAGLAMIFPSMRKAGSINRERAYSPDFSGIQAGPGAAADVRAERHRAEDLERRYRSEGNAMQPALTSADMLGMGRWHAFVHIQRAGSARQDIIRLTHDFS